jgi:hypothetical protein
LSGQCSHLIDDRLLLTAIETQGLLLQKCVPGLMRAGHAFLHAATNCFGFPCKNL